MGEMVIMRATQPLAPPDCARVREAAIFDCCKWDPQVGDVSVLAPFALTLSHESWAELRTLAEALAAETVAAEAELAKRPEFFAKLGFGRALRHALLGKAASCARFMRFDFHLTRQGWRISECNSDVPGGFNEGSGFTALMAHELGGETCGDPALALAQAVARGKQEGPVGLVHATAYADDRQVMEFLARKLASLGVANQALSPDQIEWRQGAAHARGMPLGALLRFYPAEWMPSLPRASRWPEFFSARTPAANAPRALLLQSKRWPLVWDQLKTPLPTWRALLPETRDPREANWRRDESWVLKPAFGRVGDGIGLHGATPEKEWPKIRRHAWWFPGSWVAQRRFETLPIETALGPVFPSLGVYVVDGRACGIYARCAKTPLIDQRSNEVAVLQQAPEVAHVGS